MDTTTFNNTIPEKESIHSKMNAPSTGDHNTVTRTRDTMEQEIKDTKDNIVYWKEEVLLAQEQYYHLWSLRDSYEQAGTLEEWKENMALFYKVLEDSEELFKTLIYSRL